MAFFGVTVEKIETVKNHPNAERLDICVLEGMSFQFITGRDQYFPGMDILYFPVDSILPFELMDAMGFTRPKKADGEIVMDEDGNPIMMGTLNGKQHNRVKTCRLRGELSQGIVGSIDLVGDLCVVAGFDRNPSIMSSDNITEYLGVTKYEPPPINCKNGNLCQLPVGLSVYDIEGADRYQRIVELLMDKKVLITEKLEGCLSGDSIIETLEFGEKTIKEIVEKELECHVKCLDIDSDTIIYEKVLNYSEKTDNGDWYEMETDEGKTIKLTGNHLVWLPDKKCWREVRNLQEEDLILID